MRITLIGFSTALSLLFAVLFLNPGQNSPHPAPGKGPGEPGWEEQFRRMKGDANGNIPPGVMARIHQQQMNEKTNSSLLETVQQLGPEQIGGRTRAMCWDQTTSGRMLAGGVSGGIWETTDDGLTWSPLDDQQLTLSVTSIAQSASNPQEWYFSTGESRGNSAGIPGMGIFKSVDNGASFTPLAATQNDQFDYVWKVAVNPLNANHVYAATRRDGVFRSTDAGNSWQQVYVFTPGNTEVSDVEILPDGSVLIGVNARGAFKSVTGDSGTFVRFSNGLPADSFRRVEIAWCDSVPNTIYLGIEDSLASVYFSGLKNIYKTTNGGTNWTATDNPQNSIFLSFDFPWYAFLLAVKPDNPDFIMTGSVAMAYSTNGGSSWTEASYSHADYHTAIFNPANLQEVFVGNDGGIHLYNINSMGFTSESKNNFYNVTQYYTGAFYPSGVDVLGGTQDNGTHKCANGQSAFFHVYFGDGSYCGVNQQNPLVSYASYQRGQIALALDSDQDYPTYQPILNQLDGDNDGSIDESAWFINPFELNPVNGDQVYFTTYERIWRTNNRGSTWTPLTDTIRDANGKSPYCIAVSAHNSPSVVTGGEAGLLYFMDNALLSAPGNEVDLSPTVPSNVTDHFIGCIELYSTGSGLNAYIGFTNYSGEPRIWKVENIHTASPTWTDISGNLPVELPVNWIESDPLSPTTNLVIATDAGLYTTTDGGVNWFRETAIPNVSIHMIRLRENDRKLFIFTHGRGMWTADLQSPIGSTWNEFSSDFNLFPSPASEFIRFSLSGQPVQVQQWTITSAEGKTVLSGTAAESIFVGNLPSGIYFLSGTVNWKNIRKKFLVAD